MRVVEYAACSSGGWTVDVRPSNVASRSQQQAA
jgi:hypothetical protein